LQASIQSECIMPTYPTLLTDKTHSNLLAQDGLGWWSGEARHEVTAWTKSCG